MKPVWGILAGIALLILVATCVGIGRDEAATRAAHRCLTGSLVSDRGASAPASTGGIASLNRAISTRMHNPSSYHHVVTQIHPVGRPIGGYVPGPDQSIAGARYRGTNAFGATVTNEQAALIDSTCRVIRLLD